MLCKCTIKARNVTTKCASNSTEGLNEYLSDFHKRKSRSEGIVDFKFPLQELTTFLFSQTWCEDFWLPYFSPRLPTFAFTSPDLHLKRAHSLDHRTKQTTMPKGRRKLLQARAKSASAAFQETLIQKTDDILSGGKISEKPANALFVLEKKKTKRT